MKGLEHLVTWGVVLRTRTCYLLYFSCPSKAMSTCQNQRRGVYVRELLLSVLWWEFKNGTSQSLDHDHSVHFISLENL